MRLYTIDTGFFKLDGGAMFGVVPKSIWHKLNPADDNNMCTWAARCLLIEDGNRLILIDTGLGNKQDVSFFKFYYLHGDDTLEGSLRKNGFHSSDITDVVLTHLHFDHCGGAIKYDRNRIHTEPVFENAVYWSHRSHWEWAINPNPREKASFLKENILPIAESGRLKFIDHDTDFGHNAFRFQICNGHTEAMLIPVIDTPKGTLAYCADLLPSAHHLPLPYIMSYDIRPLDAMKEKADFLEKALYDNYILFFEHDPINACATLHRTEKGIRTKELMSLADAPL